MFEDRYGLPLNTTSRHAAVAYNEGLQALLTLHPGALEAFDVALGADPDFAEARIAKARAQQLGNDLSGARATLSDLRPSLPAREASRARIFGHLFMGEGAAALAILREHLDTWPRDALALSIAANQIGIIGMSGQPGREVMLAEFLDSLAPQYAGDWWFAAHHGMALSEVGRQAEARPMIEASLDQERRNAFAAHAMGHVCYETGSNAEAIDFLHGWLADYPSNGPLRGHLHWHLALSELQRGNLSEGYRLFDEAFAASAYSGPAFLRLVDGAAFLWRAELAGAPRDATRWRTMIELVENAFPKPGVPMADWHAGLALAASGDRSAMAARIAATEALIEAGRFPWGSAVPTLLRGLDAFAAGDYVSAIAALEKMLPERERVCGSRAQMDLAEATLLRAYQLAGRTENAAALRQARRSGPAEIPVAG